MKEVQGDPQGSRYVAHQDLQAHLALAVSHFQAVQVLVNFLLDQEMICRLVEE